MNQRQKGFGLVELMVSITLGLLLMTSVVKLLQDSMKSNGDLAASKRLENNLHATLDLVARDLRRSGAMGDPIRQLWGVNNPFGRDPVSAVDGEAAASCLTFSYDFDGDGGLDANAPEERYGFRLASGVVQMRVAGNGCDTQDDASWQDVTTSGVVNVSQLQFVVNTNTARGVTQQSVQIQIAGHLVRDPEITRTLSRRVRLRNDLLL